jgi:UPF0755 protein
MKKRIIWIAAALAAVVLLAGGILGYRFWYDRRVSNFKGTAELYVYPWMEPAEVLDSLAAKGCVRSERSLRRVFSPNAVLQAGHYRVDSTCSSMYVARMLQKGWQTPVNLTLSGSIKRPGALARKIGAQMMADSAAVAAFITSNDSLAAYGADVRQLFTLVIPDTYQILWTASVREIMDRLVLEKDKWWTQERVAAARAQGLSPREVSTLASIVDGETRYEPEMPRIAAVYLNRLRIGMKLQADPTVAFCFDYQPRRILKSHLLVDSPYNTYQNAGLPPGPISCPPKACLEAVLHPDLNSYLYFCADPSFNGSHRFAVTYAEHLINARAFQKALNERGTK